MAIYWRWSAKVGKRTKTKTRTGPLGAAAHDVRRPSKLKSTARRSNIVDEKPTLPKTARKTAGSLAASLLETARDMYESGVMDKAGYEKITLRHLGAGIETSFVQRLSAGEIRKLRERANMSQGVFAKVLNITPGYVSQLERGDKVPTGSTLAMLNVIKRKGIDAIL
ncbi:helix-turn-helix domain-containing protein [Bradyrhizobium oligotrophicum]|uniref:helix-turn-helix domain-containing protein n=1 Tax=Bradyrhizobium oligotrophicum TaxID=44255 RepID=UPI003EBF5232